VLRIQDVFKLLITSQMERLLLLWQRMNAINEDGWFRGSAVQSWSLTFELSLTCAQPTADG